MSKAPTRSRLCESTITVTAKTRFRCELPRNHPGTHRRTIVPTGQTARGQWYGWERR